MKATKWDKGDGYFDSPPRRDKPHPALCTQQKGERVLIHNAAPGGSLPTHCPMRRDATTAVRPLNHVSKERPSCPFLAHGSDHRVKKAVGVGVLTQQHRENTEASGSEAHIFNRSKISLKRPQNIKSQSAHMMSECLLFLSPGDIFLASRSDLLGVSNCSKGPAV